MNITYYSDKVHFEENQEESQEYDDSFQKYLLEYLIKEFCYKVFDILLQLVEGKVWLNSEKHLTRSLSSVPSPAIAS